jgi:hypothetical protein
MGEITRESWVVACHVVGNNGQIVQEAVWTEEVCLPLVRSTETVAKEIALAMRQYRGMKYVPSNRHIIVAVRMP